MTEDEMVAWHPQLNGHEFEQALGDGEEQDAADHWVARSQIPTEQPNNVTVSSHQQHFTPGLLKDVLPRALCSLYPPLKLLLEVLLLLLLSLSLFSMTISLFSLKTFKCFPSKDTKVSLQVLAKNRSWVFKLYVNFFNFVFSHQIHLLKNICYELLDPFFSPLSLTLHWNL